MSGSLLRRLEQLEQCGGGEMVDLGGHQLTGRQLAALLREIDGKTRGLPSEWQRRMTA